MQITFDPTNPAEVEAVLAFLGKAEEPKAEEPKASKRTTRKKAEPKPEPEAAEPEAAEPEAAEPEAAEPEAAEPEDEKTVESLKERVVNRALALRQTDKTRLREALAAVGVTRVSAIPDDQLEEFAGMIGA